MTDVKIIHIEDDIANVDDKQLAVEATPDADLGFRMWGGKDGNGAVTKWLAKDKPARVQLLSAHETVSAPELYCYQKARFGANTGDVEIYTENNEYVVVRPNGEIAAKDKHLAAEVQLSEPGETALVTSKQSLVGAINEAASTSLQDAYENGGTITVGTTPLQAAVSGGAPILLQGKRGSLISVQDLGTEDQVNVASTGELQLNDKHLTSAVTLSEPGETALATTKQSIIGAINELVAGAGGSAYQVYEGRMLGQASNTDALLCLSPATTSNPGGIPLTTPYDTYANGGCAPFLTHGEQTLVACRVVCAAAAVMQSSVAPNPEITVDIYSHSTTSRSLLGTALCVVDNYTDVGIFNNLGGTTNMIEAYLDMTSLGIVVPDKTLLGFQVRSQSGNNSLISSVRAVTVSLVGRVN